MGGKFSRERNFSSTSSCCVIFVKKKDTNVREKTSSIDFIIPCSGTQYPAKTAQRTIFTVRRCLSEEKKFRTDKKEDDKQFHKQLYFIFLLRRATKNKSVEH